MRWAVPLGVLAASLAAGQLARADWRNNIVSLPGASQAISHSMSASRDTALVGYQLTPHSVLTGGADVGLVELRSRDVSIRLGFFGFLEVESAAPFSLCHNVAAGVLPGAGFDFLRGHDGLHLAVAFRRAGEESFGRDGLLEVTMGFRHESDHYVGPNVGGSATDYSLVPQIGNFVLFDLAARIPHGKLTIELRAQTKVFTRWSPAGVPERDYTIGPGFDAIARWRLLSRLHPFASLFGEWLVGDWIVREGGSFRAPDDRLLRLLVGGIVPGRFGGVQLFSSVSVGNGKGLLVLRNELLWVVACAWRSSERGGPACAGNGVSHRGRTVFPDLVRRGERRVRGALRRKERVDARRGALRSETSCETWRLSSC
jgi:hypothetical protein